MYAHPYYAEPVWVDGTKLIQRIVGFNWTIEVEGTLHREYVPQYEIRRKFFFFGPSKKVEINTPVPGTCSSTADAFYYVDANCDTRKITRDLIPTFRVPDKK